ncbi:MAG: AAA family ATPase [Bacteroidia bacterium]|nr:AAA family ATPase [Bacteroidia bacterium]
MEKLFQFSVSRINSAETSFKRYLWKKINWNNRLIAITGARGVGKTTLLLQYIKENLNERPDEVIYVNMDDLYFSKNALVDFADNFVKRGGNYLFLDEVHKYKNWSQEIKNCYDYFPDLKIVLTGSSALNIYKGKADLSRRAMLYKLHGLSFREFIALKYNYIFPVLELDDLLNNAPKKIPAILEKIKPLKLFEEYLQFGYYPFFREGEDEFQIRLKQTVNHILDSDLPSVEKIDFNAVHYLRKLVSILAEIVPYKPNIVKLSQQVGVSRETLVRYLYLLEKADLLILLQTSAHGISKMNKPEKIYLNNPNLVYSLADNQSNQGTLRETFFLNQLQVLHKISRSEKSDFLVDDKHTFEIGGKNKNRKQIAGIENAFVAADNIEFSQGNKIPLWLFGFLY